MILTSYMVPVSMVAERLTKSYLSIALSKERNEYGIYPTDEQIEGTTAGCNYLMRDEGAWAYLKSGGMLSVLMESMSNVSATDDFKANSVWPLKGWCFPGDMSYPLVPIDDPDRHLTSRSTPDEILDENSRAADRAKDPNATIILEEIDPTWVYKFISWYLNRCRNQSNSGFYAPKYVSRDTALIKDEDGESLSWANIVVDDSDGVNKDVALKELAYHCRFLYEASKRFNIGIHLLAACAYIKYRRNATDAASITPTVLCWKHTLWYNKGEFVARAYGQEAELEKYPGINMTYNYIKNGSGFTPEIDKSIEAVIHLTSILGIDMMENEHGSWISSNGKYKTECTKYYYEKFNEYGSTPLPKMLRETFIPNDKVRSDMYDILRFMYLDNDTQSSSSVSAFDVAKEIYSKFEDNFQFLSLGVRNRTLEDYAMSDKAVLNSITKTWRIYARNQYSYFTDYVTFDVNDELVKMYRLVDGILCLCVGTTKIPVMITINGIRHIAVSGGYLLPVCTVNGSKPCAPDYVNIVYIYTIKTVVESVAAMRNVNEDARLKLIPGGA